MGDSYFRKIQKILEKPPVPAHIQQRQYRVVIPWYERLWQTVRPPKPVPSTRPPMTKPQRRLLASAVVAALTVGVAWYAFDRVTNAPARAQSAYQEGMRALGPSDFARAVGKFSESIALSETAVARLERGNAYKNLRQDEQALADWSRAIELDPNLAAAYAARGTYYRTAQEHRLALADLDRSIQLAPSVDGFFQRGQVYVALGQYDQAIQDYDRAITQRRDAPYVYLARSIAKRALGDEAGFQQDQKLATELLEPNKRSRFPTN
jgi:tetratricopeptide (TPR) repeat protein